MSTSVSSKSLQRRQFIRLAGGGLVLAAAATQSVRAAPFDVPDSAVAAWRGPGAETDVRRWALAHALLAPNPHNLQPWLADLRVASQITLSLDPARQLPQTDPYGRQIVMGAGAFLELLAQAAAERGFRAEIALFPAGEPGERIDGRAFAVVKFEPDANAVRDPLFAHVLNRRTDRRAYDPSRPVTAAQASALQAATAGLPVRFGLAGAAASDAARVEAIRAIAREAWKIELTTPATMMESMRLLRFGSSEIDRHRDGIAITSPMLVTLAKLGFINREEFPAPDSSATQQQIAGFDAATASTPAYLWLVTEGNSRRQQIDAGRAYVRVNLAATALGLSVHPNEQALQEYPQVQKPFDAVHRLLDAPRPTHTVQMLARLGHAAPGTPVAPPAPRRGLAALLGQPQT